MRYVRQSTQTDIIIGPLVDDTDFKTAETAVAYNAAGIDVDAIKNGTKADITLANSAGDGYWRHVANGYYALTLSTAHTETVGRLRVTFVATGVLAAWEDFQVVEEAVYDAMFAADAAGFAPAATALTNATWTDSKAGYLDAAVTSRSTYAGADTAGTTTLLSRITVAITPPLVAEAVRDLASSGLSALKTLLDAALTRLPDAAPGAAGGLPRVSDLPAPLDATATQAAAAAAIAAADVATAADLPTGVSIPAGWTTLTEATLDNAGAALGPVTVNGVASAGVVVEAYADGAFVNRAVTGAGGTLALAVPTADTYDLVFALGGKTTVTKVVVVP